jgi:methionine aminopeptidase
MLPDVFHQQNLSKEILVPGMCFTIEPIIYRPGIFERLLRVPGLTWRPTTAQFEHTVLMTANGPITITK